MQIKHEQAGKYKNSGYFMKDLTALLILKKGARKILTPNMRLLPVNRQLIPFYSSSSKAMASRVD
jgi:hypothetical protein